LAIEGSISQCSQTVATNADAMQWPHVEGKKLGHIALKGLLASRGGVPCSNFGHKVVLVQYGRAKLPAVCPSTQFLVYD